MNKYELQCRYCGKVWQLFWLPEYRPICQKCGDDNIDIKDISKTKIDYYEEKKPKINDDTYNQYSVQVNYLPVQGSFECHPYGRN